MSSKNSTPLTGNLDQELEDNSARLPWYSLRLHLMFWYSGLLALGLTCFGLLVLFLASNAINDNVRKEIQAETIIVQNNPGLQFQSQPSYWPAHLALHIQNTYSTNDTTVEIVDPQGNILYSSNNNMNISMNRTVIPQLDHTDPPIWYTITIQGKPNLVGASPIYSDGSFLPATRKAHASLIGILLVAKSLSDSNTTLNLLQTLLLLTGAIMLVLFLICGWAIIGYALRPLTDMVQTASSIASALTHGKRLGNLKLRVKRPGGEDETARIVDAFNEVLNAIESSTAAQRRFIADASHELRAPLTTVQGNLAFLIRYIEDIPPGERHTMLADAHGETLRLASLVEELLLLARADARDTYIGQTSNLAQDAPVVELDRTLLGLVRQQRRRLEIEGSALKIEIGRIEPVRVRGDEESMRRIMVILLENAIKYTRTEKGKGGGKITVALERLETEAVLRVSDTGIGISESDLPHIFERFYRADQARSRAGTGLGLAIAQTLVEQLDGRITADSIPGEGSTFYVSLPLA